MEGTEKNIFDLPELRNRVRVFRDREHAGKVLAGMLESMRGARACVLGIPAGGIPVAQVIARDLELKLDTAVVSKITLPWNTEAGYGAVAFDGTVCLNQDLVESLALGEAVVNDGIARTRDKVDARLKRLRGGRPVPDPPPPAAPPPGGGRPSRGTPASRRVIRCTRRWRRCAAWTRKRSSSPCRPGTPIRS